MVAQILIVMRVVFLLVSHSLVPRQDGNIFAAKKQISDIYISRIYSKSDNIFFFLQREK